MRILNILIIMIVKISIRTLKIIGKKAGTFPGKLAIKLNKNIYTYFKVTGKIIVITGTNGKTTTNNMIYQILNKNNKVVSNIGGNNIGWGIVSTLISNCNIFGKVDCDYLVLETDEHWVAEIYKNKNLKLDTLIVLNFFRDQLDRAGELETLILKLYKFIENNPCNLILNGNDPNVLRLGMNNKGKNYYYGVCKLPISKIKSHDKMEGIICPNCKIPLKYEYYHYAHIGAFECNKCGFGKINYDTLVEKIEGNKIYIGNSIYEINKPDLYNIYNILSIITLSKIYKINSSSLKSVIKNYKSNNGRGEEFKINNNSVILQLGKNPTGFNVVFKAMKEDKNKKDLLVIINDKVNDGFDVSWIWDIDFSNISSFNKIICSGSRASDLAVRIKCAGYQANKIEIIKKEEEAIDKLVNGNNKKYIISNYSSLTKVKEYLEYKEKRNI